MLYIAEETQKNKRKSYM